MSTTLRPKVTYCPDCTPIPTRHVVATARTFGPPCPRCGTGQAIIILAPEYWPVWEAEQAAREETRP